MMTKHVAAARLGREVPAAEAAFDEALLRLTDVIQTSVTARRESGVKASTGQPTLLRLHKAMGHLLAAQGEIMRAHAQLAEMGVETGVLDEPYCPPPEAIEQSLHAASSAA
jgi:hypothetical protein